jgi:hypothetical protein
VSGTETHAAIEKEIRAEKAGALSRALEALEAALEALARFDAGSRTSTAAALRADLVADAGERLWFLVIQREAMGLLRHDVLYEVVRVPAEVRRAMGPRLPR